MDSVHAAGLSDVRRICQMTQVQVAAEMGIDQGSVSELERRADIHVSTLRRYLDALGGENPRIVAHKNGVEINLYLDTILGLWKEDE